jgi:hypothetical protein
VKLRLLAALACAAALLAAAPARAQTIDPATRSTARKLGQEALKLYDDGEYAAALAKLDTADRLVPTPTLGLYAARCLAKLGRWVEASERYLDVSRMPLDRSAPPLMRKAQADAVVEREKLLPTIPQLVIRLEGPRGEGVTVTVDDKPLDLGLIGEKRAVDPGMHRASAKRADAETSGEAALKPGQTSQILLTLPPLPPPPEERSPPLRVVGWVGVGLGAAAGVFAAVNGGISLAQEKTLLAKCGASHDACPPSLAGTLSTYRVTTKLTTAGMVTGLVALGFGIPVLALSPRSEWVDAHGKPVPPPQDHRPAARGPRVETFVTLGGAGVRGIF